MRYTRFWLHWLVFATLITCATVLSWFYLDLPILGIDDAYIFFVYGKHIANGFGGVYNIGGERVEGFSSPLWTLIITGCYVLTNNPQILLLAISIIAMSGALAFLSYQLNPKRIFSLLQMLLIIWVLSSPSFILWHTLSLMDVAIWTTCLITTLTCALWIERIQRSWFALSLIALVLARPEAMAWGLIALGIAGLNIASSRSISIGASLHWLLGPILAFFTALLILTLFRLWYFGYPFPNTYYAKVSPDRWYNLKEGLTYLKNYFLATPILWIILIIDLLLLMHVRKSRNSVHLKIMMAIGLSVVGLLLPLISGGDHFELFRFYQPIWIILVLPLSLWIAEYSIKRRYLIVGITIIFICAIVPFLRISFLNPEFHVAKNGLQTGIYLEQMLPDKPSVGVIAAGGFKYSYSGDVFDTMGLNDTQVAHTLSNRYGKKNHAAFNQAIFLQRHPLIFVPTLGSQQGLRDFWTTSWFDFLKEVTKDMVISPDFQQHYALIFYGDTKRSLLMFVDRDYLKTLDQSKISELDFATALPISQ